MLTVEQLEELKQFDSPTICNAIERFNVRSKVEGWLSHKITQVIPYEGPMVGYASTAKFATAKAPEKPLPMEGYFRHIQATPRPSISVQEDLEPEVVAALWGEVNCHIHMSLGSLGTVTNGGVRDLKEAKALGFRYHASCVAVSHGYIHIEDCNCPVNLFGLTIRPGDLLFCDNQGVVTIPHEVADKLAEACRKIIAAEFPVIRFCKDAITAGKEIDIAELLKWQAVMKKLRVE
ncbi:MAG: RraA family protein [Spirochaetia bacterium]|jgi:regulator of RNase E activity RraA|nr:RraA family protein [Spirochaetia bacterium]